MAKRTLKQLMAEDNFVLQAGGYRPVNSFAFSGGMGGPNVGRNPLDIGGVVTMGGNAACGSIPNAKLRQICLAGATIIGGEISRRVGNAGNRPSNTGSQLASCPEGYERNAAGTCVEGGFRGRLERWMPGGQTGTLADDMGEATVGAFGMPAMMPGQVAVPTLTCGRGFVLGADDLCYPKGSIPREFRKWKPARRPLLSARDASIMSKAKSVEKRLKKYSGKFVPKARSCSCKGRKK